MSPIPVLAAGIIDSIVPIIFVIIAIGGAISNAINSNKQQPPRKNAGGRPKDQRVRKEIDEFIEQQGGRKSRPIEVGPDEIEVVNEPPRRRPTPPARPVKASAPQRKAPAPAAPRPAPPRASAPPTQVTKRGDAPLASQGMGSGLREHLKTAMAERVASQAQRDLPHLATSVDQKVREDLGEFAVSGKAAAVHSESSPLILMLRNPKTVRNAVLMAEILGPPKALRK